MKVLHLFSQCSYLFPKSGVWEFPVLIGSPLLHERHPPRLGVHGWCCFLYRGNPSFNFTREGTLFFQLTLATLVTSVTLDFNQPASQPTDHPSSQKPPQPPFFLFYLTEDFLSLLFCSIQHNICCSFTTNNLSSFWRQAFSKCFYTLCWLKKTVQIEHKEIEIITKGSHPCKIVLQKNPLFSPDG